MVTPSPPLTWIFLLNPKCTLLKQTWLATFLHHQNKTSSGFPTGKANVRLASMVMVSLIQQRRESLTLSHSDSLPTWQRRLLNGMLPARLAHTNFRRKRATALQRQSHIFLTCERWQQCQLDPVGSSPVTQLCFSPTTLVMMSNEWWCCLGSFFSCCCWNGKQHR